MSVADLAIAGSAGIVAGLLFDIPDADNDEFLGTVSAEERARVREVLRAFREIAACRSLRRGCENAALRRAHLGWGWSAKSLSNLFLVYRNGGHKPGDFRKSGPIYPPGDWRVLLRDFKGRAVSGPPPEFIRWLSEQFTQFKGRADCMSALWRHLVHEIWLKGHPVPGYGTVDDWCRRMGRARPHPLLVRPGELPEGWSDKNLRRYLPRRKVVRVQNAHGYLAAHQHQPDQVLGDRAPLMPLQYVYLDDTRPDLRCTFFQPGGRGEIVYPLLVLGLDASSGVDVANALKPRALKHPDAESPDERKSRHGVTQDMALAVVLETLRWGLPPWPITFVHENAAACVPTEAKRMIEGALGDRVQFEATGIFKERMMAHGFSDQGGTPYDKAPIESFFRIMATQIARLPGSTGPRYDTAPGELAQIEKYTLGLMDRAGGLKEVFDLFRSPLLDFHDAHKALEAALRLLRFRTKHQLQGFSKLREWRRSPSDSYRPWSELLALPEAEQNAVSDIIERLETPAERFCSRLAGVALTPVDEDLIAWIGGPRQRVRVRDGKITVGSCTHDVDRLVFRETDHPLLGAEGEGREFEGVIAGDGGRIVLTHEGRVLGHVLRQDRISRADPEAMKREAGRVRAARCADRDQLRGYLLIDTDEALAELRAHNEAVVNALPAPATIVRAARAEKTPKPTAATMRNNQRRAQQMAEAVRDTEL